MARPAVVFDRLGTLADPTRSRILLVLEGTQLTVGELCAVVQLPQSTVSRHLRILSDEGWVAARDSGASRFYTLVPSRLDHFARRDRKSTRLNSSHLVISYAVFCLKKKNIKAKSSDVA